MNTVKSAPRFVNDTQVMVTKEFAKNARIFGTAEYKLWKEIRLDCPNAEMITKTIKRNPSKKVDTRNMTYANMEAYIKQQDDAEALLAEFKKQIKMSKVQTNPYVVEVGISPTHRTGFVTRSLSELLAAKGIDAAMYNSEVPLRY